MLAQRSGLTISPLNFELTANPGDVIVNKVTVYNPTESVISVNMEVEDFSVAGEGGQVVVEPSETETYSLARWVTTIPSTFTLQPDERQIVDFIIELPQNAEPGGHYGSVLASTGGVAGSGFTGAAIAQKIGSLVLLSVAGDVVEDVQIKEFTAPNFLEFGPVPFVLRFENTGTIHVKPKGFITVSDWRNQKMIDIEFPQKNVLPSSIRKIEAEWDEKWLFGKYTATVIGSYGTSNTPISPWIITFWVIPWKILTVGGVISLFLLSFFYFTRRRWFGALGILIKGDKRS